MSNEEPPSSTLPNLLAVSVPFPLLFEPVKCSISS